MGDRERAARSLVLSPAEYIHEGADARVGRNNSFVRQYQYRSNPVLRLSPYRPPHPFFKSNIAL